MTPYIYDPQALMALLPPVRGRVSPMADLSALSWFRVGGPAEVLFSPADAEDLAAFLKATPEDVPVTVIGVGSNLLIRDGGLPGVVIRLGRGFNAIEALPDARIRAGAAALDAKVAEAAAEAGVAGLEFLRGVPGAIGGALRMNAGCYGTEIKDRIISCVGICRRGVRRVFTPEEMGFAYRSSTPENVVFIEVDLQGEADDPQAVKDRMRALMEKREAAQPVKSRTGGSTFRNPAGHSTVDGSHMPLAAWKLIDDAGCRGMTVGQAQVSPKHTNFLINLGGATAEDIETLGEEVRRRVKATSGHDLQWEIRRIGLARDAVVLPEAAA